MGNVVLISTRQPPPAAPKDGTPSLEDAAARLRALDTEASCIVEAPAGSGKTGLLVQRMLKLLAHPGVSAPEEVLAITFTNKATAELRERVLKQLQAAAAANAPEPASGFDRATRALAAAVLARDRELSWSLLDRPQRLNIRTIDSVAAEIANALPLLSGSGGRREPAQDPEPLYREAARRTLRQLGGDNRALHAALHTVLLHRDGNLADCETLLARMLAAREQWGELVPLGPGALDEATLDREVRPRLERSLEAVVCAGLSRALRAMPPGFLADLTAFAARLGLEPGYNGKSSPIALCAGRQREPEALAEDLDHWAALIRLLIKPSDGSWRASFSRNHIGFEIPKNDAAWLKEKVAAIQTDELCEALCVVAALPPPRYPDEQWIVARALFHLLRHALAELKLLFSERGECDFAEFALAAREALRADGGAADFSSSAGAGLQHLLVDEMQDTSSGQYELIDLLTRSFDGHSQTLFLVGDPKQSIYLFRQARVERFLRTVRERQLGDLRLEPLRLSANFRSQAALVENLNAVFTEIFPSPEAASREPAGDAGVTFAPAVAARAASSGADLDWHLALPEESPDGDPEAGITPAQARFEHGRAEALAIRRIVEGWQSRPLPPHRAEPWRIAVLARTRSHLADIVAEFKSRAHGDPIAFRAVDVDSLAERPEVLDALALTRALLHPADRIAWLAVLHAPWCGLGLADLLQLTGEGAEADPHATVASLVDRRRNRLSPAGQQLLARCWPVLQAAVAAVGRAPFSVQVERTWRSLGGDAPLLPASRSNVLRVFDILRELEAGGDVDLAVLNARIARLFSEPAASGEAAVELMTIHKAKGLEWDVVILPGIERRERPSGSDLLNWLELDGGGPDAAHVLLAPIWGKGEASDRLNNWMKNVRKARETAERKRLFYVACTRAREELHLFAAARLNRDGALCKPAPGSLLGACWPAAAKQFERFLTAPRPSADPGADHSDDLRRALQEALTRENESASYSGLALAAAADNANGNANGRSSTQHEGDASDASGERAIPSQPLLRRLPLSFDPLARFDTPASTRLDYPPAADLPHSASFERPEGSFAVRAFGNVVHRYLQLLAERLSSACRDEGVTAETLLAELLAGLPSWEPRLTASFRGEGLAPIPAAREAGRAVRALTHTLTDATGRWILAPHPSAATEAELTSPGGRVLRADRIFSSGPAPGSHGETCIWIVDFKTTDEGSRSGEGFAEDEVARYRPQLNAYAEIYRSATGHTRPVHLGLYYPLSARFFHWQDP